MSCNLKSIAFGVFYLNMSFTYFWISYNIVKLQTCTSIPSRVIATLRFSLLSKSVVIIKSADIKSGIYVKQLIIKKYRCTVTKD